MFPGSGKNLSRTGSRIRNTGLRDDLCPQGVHYGNRTGVRKTKKTRIKFDYRHQKPTTSNYNKDTV
jgi:hypothetical protein